MTQSSTANLGIHLQAPSFQALTDEPHTSHEVNYVLELVRKLFAERRTWPRIITAALIEALFALASPWVAARAIDTALPNSAQNLLTTLAGVIVIAVAHTAWAAWLHQRATLVLRRHIESHCLRTVVERYLATPYPKLVKTDFGSTSETISAASTVALTIVALVVEYATLSASGVVALGMLVVYSPTLAATAVVVSIVLATTSALLSLREAHCARRVLDASSRSQGLLNTLLHAVSTLRASGATERFSQRWAALVRDQTREAIYQEKARLNRAAVTLGAERAVSLTATAWLVSQVLDGRTSLGVMMTCTMLLGNLLRVALGLTESLVRILVIRPHIARVNSLMRESAIDASRARYVPYVSNEADQLELRLDNVWFRYDPRSRWVLEGYTRKFPVGQISLLRAASGVGKTTILRLLAGLIRADSGQVSVMGCDPSTTRGLVAYLPQQSTLFEGSIAANLKALSGAPLQRVLEVAQLTGLADMLDQLPMGLDTLVSAAGTNMSAGQHQLVALTAAFASPCPVVLLDEATSQLDAMSQEHIQWRKLARGRTVVSVHHQ